MRVVGGSARGRQLRSPRGDHVRPTSDRVREAVFNMLDVLGGVDGLAVADLFAGTGALGIEALSRGAARATFVERDRDAAALVQANLDTLGLGAAATVVRADAVRWAETAPAVDIAFVDPPYAFAGWPALLGHLRAELVVVESDRELDLGDRWRLLKRKQYGSTVVLVARTATDTAGTDR